MAMLLMTDGNHRPIRPTDDRQAFTLPELHRYVGGYIEVVAAPPVDGQLSYLVLNEDGKRDKPFNGFATFLFHLAGGPVDDWIAGDVVYCSRAEIEEEADDDDDLDDLPICSHCHRRGVHAPLCPHAPADPDD